MYRAIYIYIYIYILCVAGVPFSLLLMFINYGRFNSQYQIVCDHSVAGHPTDSVRPGHIFPMLWVEHQHFTLRALQCQAVTFITF